MILVPLPTMIRQTLSYSTAFTLQMTAVILFAHLVAMKANECRANFPDLLHPMLLALHFLSFPFEDLVSITVFNVHKICSRPGLRIFYSSDVGFQPY